MLDEGSISGTTGICSPQNYFLRHPLTMATTPASRASAAMPDDGSISGTEVKAHKEFGAPTTSNATTARTGDTAFPDLYVYSP
jgi:hypothetical protein